MAIPFEADAKGSKTKHRKSTCAGCRRRKSKCDGRTPKCTTCIAYKDECHYDKPPSLAYVRSLEEENQELKSQLRQIKTQFWLSKSHVDKRETRSTTPSDTAASHDSANLHNLPYRSRHPKWETDISIDDQGGITFHNSTSAVHEPPRAENDSPLRRTSSTSAHSTPSDDERTKRDLVLNATQQRQFELYAIARGSARINLPKETSRELLNYHWCWIHPLFLFVYRPAFTKGMAMIDYSSAEAAEHPHFSDTLLKVILAHSSRFLKHDIYEQAISAEPHSLSRHSVPAHEFRRRMTDEARFGLGVDMLKISTIPTIQALLQQSAREVVFGHASQAWTFAGVAFRMALDLGIHLPSERLQSFIKGLTPEDVEIRKRLFWSCYTWDKILSLYLGRMPGFAHSAMDDIPPSFMDDYSDTDLWSPYYGEMSPEERSKIPTYPSSPGYVVSCFQQLCRLCVILNDLMQDIYSPEAAARREEEQNSTEAKIAHEQPFLRISQDLREWLMSLPPHLRIDSDQMPTLAPPAHIVSLNLLYHTTIILLHRPIILGSPDLDKAGPAQSYRNCLNATASIHDLLILQSSTFGLSHLSYLNVYSAYIGATVAVLKFERDFRDGDDYRSYADKSGLTFLLEVLNRSARSMPVLEKSSAIIRKRITSVLNRQEAHYPREMIIRPQFSLTTAHDFDMVLPVNAQSESVFAMSGYSDTETGAIYTASPTWQDGSQNGLSSEHAIFTEEFLPAFPGQRFPVEMDQGFESVDTSSHASRNSLPGYNLDPHTRLNVGDIDWRLMETFERPATSLHSLG